MIRSSYTPRVLDLVFGQGDGDTPEARARGSKRVFIRGLDQLRFDEKPQSKGRRFSAMEALDAFGFDTLAEVANEGIALLYESVDSAGRPLRERREQLNLDIRHVAASTQLDRKVIEALEASKRRPLREYEKVARVLGLDERLISFRSDIASNQGIAVRLREISGIKNALMGQDVLALTEAAWVAMVQIRLEGALRVEPPSISIDTEPFYGSAQVPAYKVGYDLAVTLRESLGVGEEPIASMRDLVERQLQIPVIQTNLGDQIAGATVDVNGRRAIVLNLSGKNTHVFIRRATLAHELCHLLFDPRQQLRSLRVDEYSDLDRRADQLTDRVEQRANAFAAEFLAPQHALRQSFAENDLGQLIEQFGISFTAARYQLWNALDRRVALDSLQTPKVKPEADWDAREAYTTTYHPIRSLADHPSRAGRFSALVLRAAEAGVVSWDSACEWLYCADKDLRDASGVIHGLYSDVFVE